MRLHKLIILLLLGLMFLRFRQRIHNETMMKRSIARRRNRMHRSRVCTPGAIDKELVGVRTGVHAQRGRKRSARSSVIRVLMMLMMMRVMRRSYHSMMEEAIKRTHQRNISRNSTSPCKLYEHLSVRDVRRRSSSCGMMMLVQ